MIKNGHKFILEAPDRKLEFKNPPTKVRGESKLEFYDEAANFLYYDIYKSGGVNAQVKYLCLKKDIPSGNWVKIYSRILDLSDWSKHDDLFQVKYSEEENQ